MAIEQLIGFVALEGGCGNVIFLRPGNWRTKLGSFGVEEDFDELEDGTFSEEGKPKRPDVGQKDGLQEQPECVEVGSIV